DERLAPRCLVDSCARIDRSHRLPFGVRRDDHPRLLRRRDARACSEDNTENSNERHGPHTFYSGVFVTSLEVATDRTCLHTSCIYPWREHPEPPTSPHLTP